MYSIHYTNIRHIWLAFPLRCIYIHVMSNTRQINVRVPTAILDALLPMLRNNNVRITDAVCQMMRAAVDYIDANGGRWITPALVRAGDEPRKLMAAAEPRGEYSARPLSSARVADPPAGLRAKHTRKAGSRKIA